MPFTIEQCHKIIILQRKDFWGGGSTILLYATALECSVQKNVKAMQDIALHKLQECIYS